MRKARFRALCAVGFAIALPACSGGERDERDAGEVDAAVDDAGPMAVDVVADALAIAQPIAPALPVLTPCPAGWSEVVSPDDGIATCEPWPADATACAGALARIPGDAACREVGDPCPAGEWAPGLPAGRVLYVRMGATGGDGTMAAPYGLVSTALTNAVAGDTIAVGKGTWTATVPAKQGVTLWGACASQSIIHPNLTSSTVPVVTVAVPNVVLKNLTIGSSHTRKGMIVSAGGAVDLRGVLITGAARRGVEVIGGRMTGDRVVLRDVSPEDDATATALEITAGGDVQIDHFVIEKIPIYGARIEGASSRLTLRDGAIGELVAGSTRGLPLVAREGGVAVLERAVIEDLSGGLATAQASSLSLTDVLLRDLGGAYWYDPLDPDRLIEGSVIRTVSRGAITLTRVVMERIAQGTIHANGRFEATDMVVRGGLFAYLSGNSAVTLHRVSLDRGRRDALQIRSASVVELSDLIITRSIGPGLVVSSSAITVARARIEGAGAVGFLASDASGTVSDLSISGTVTRVCVRCNGVDTAAHGLGIYYSSRLNVRRFELRGNAVCGIQLVGELDLHDGLIASNPIGINVQVAGFDYTRIGDRVVFQDNQSNVDTQDLPVPPPPGPLAP